MYKNTKYIYKYKYTNVNNTNNTNVNNVNIYIKINRLISMIQKKHINRHTSFVFNFF